MQCEFLVNLGSATVRQPTRCVNYGVLANGMGKPQFTRRVGCLTVAHDILTLNRILADSSLHCILIPLFQAKSHHLPNNPHPNGSLHCSSRIYGLPR